MTIEEVDFLPLQPIRIRANGKRDYDPAAKQRLIQMCVSSGASVSSMALKEEDGTTQVKVAGHTRKPRGRKPLDPGLPRVEVRHELLASERVCPHDGQALVEIGIGISEQLDIVAQQIRVLQHQRVKYACPCCDAGIRTTPAPACVIPKGLLTESALAWCITAKYQDGLPLYRQAGLLNCFGGDLSRAKLAASVVRVGKAVQPLISKRPPNTHLTVQPMRPASTDAAAARRSGGFSESAAA